VLSLLDAAPLLKEEPARRPGRIAESLQPSAFPSALRRDRSPTDDDPIDAAKIWFSQMFKQRFDAQETRTGGSVAQIVDARQAVFPVLDADAHHICGAMAAASAAHTAGI